MPIIPAAQEVENGRIMIHAWPAKAVSETPSQPISQVCWCMPVIPATRETLVGLQSKAGPGKNT
jgi:hypothetical protein